MNAQDLFFLTRAKKMFAPCDPEEIAINGISKKQYSIVISMST